MYTFFIYRLDGMMMGPKYIHWVERSVCMYVCMYVCSEDPSS